MVGAIIVSENEDTQQELRAEADFKRLGQIPQNAFSTLMDEAVLHASQTVNADAQAVTNPWRNLGPRNVGGRIRTMTVHPRDGNIIYAGSALGSIWKTTDGGDSWTPLDDFRPANGARQALPVGAIAISQSNPGTIYVGTGEPVNGYISGNGLFRSTNDGGHFTQIDHPGTGAIRSHHFERIRVDPWNANRVWCAAFNRGLWRSRPNSFPGFQQDVIDAPGAPIAANQVASDILVNWGDPRGTPPDRYTVFVALHGAGVYRASFIRANDAYDTSGATVWTQVNIPGLAALPSFNRVKIALCDTRPLRMYCVAGDNNNRFSNVFRSNDGGVNWNPTVGQPGSNSGITWYALVLECNPSDPDVVFLGQMDMWCSNDGGVTWGTPNPNPPPPNFLPCLDWTRYSQGDRAQHADQHAVVFDRDRPHLAWIGNDGGISLTTDLGRSWRKRSHGILATQFTDISSHPTYPFMMGGGLQDNGSWLTYGGMSWYNVGGGDGGDMGFEPGNPRLFHVSDQNAVRRGQMGTAFAPPGFSYPSPAVDIPVAINPSGVVRADTVATAGYPPSPNNPPLPFYGLLVHHPRNAMEALVGYENNAYRTTNGQNFAQIGHAVLTAHGAPTQEICALAYGFDQVNNHHNHWWVGSSTGEIFYTANAGAAWQNRIEPLAARGNWISAIATHPANPAIAVIAVASNPGALYITGNNGANWLEIGGSGGAGGANWSPRPAAGAGDMLNPGPITAVAFDPASSATLTDPQTIYAGTLTGVYVIRNALVPTTATPIPMFQPIWRTYNAQLPLTMIYDMEAVQFQDAGGSQHNRLRIATFGRGVYEADLSNNTATRLLVRQHINDNGLVLPNANTMGDDPRLPPGTNLTSTQAIDIRVDSQPFLYFGRVADSVEFDQQLRSTDVISGEVNLIYVQVNNTGSRPSSRVQVSLYWAEAPGAPPAAPNLPANFWNGYPLSNPAPWELIATEESTNISSGAPVILRFQWLAPDGLPANLALLSLVHDNDRDSLIATPPAAFDFPTLVTSERRAALRIAGTRIRPADGLLRDGFDDRGALGETAWGARCHDIVVVQTTEANPDGAFADTNDLRPGDVLDGSATNHIYVRVRNKGSQVLNTVQVELFQIPLGSIADFSTWVSRGTATLPSIAAGAVAFVPAITWTNPPDPAPNKVHLLAALVNATDDSRPDPATRINSVAEFWKFFLEEVDSNNAALRGLHWNL